MNELLFSECMYELLSKQTLFPEVLSIDWLIPIIATLKKKNGSNVKPSGVTPACSSSSGIPEMGGLWVLGQPDYKENSYLKNKVVSITFSPTKHYQNP